jgi:hypothetical protein
MAGGVTPFGTPIPGALGEIYVSSSLGLGGFGSRDVFAGPQNLTTVFRFNNDGTGQVPFALGLAGGVRGIAFDPIGLYGNNMIVTTSSGNVYKVTSAGTVSLLASVGEDTEGLSFAPQAFGPFAKGTLVVASEGSGTLRAIAPNGTVTVVTHVPSAEMVSFVPLNLGISGNPLEGFYAANFNVDVIHAAASQFSGFLGDIVVTGETTHNLTDVMWNGTSFVTSTIGTFPNQPEDGVFVTAATLNPGCDVTNTCGSSVPEPGSLALFGAASAALAFARRRKLI